MARSIIEETQDKTDIIWKRIFELADMTEEKQTYENLIEQVQESIQDLKCLKSPL